MLEIAPGALVWSVFAFSLVASFRWPTAVITFVVLFYVFWLLRVVYFVVYLIIAWRHYRRESRYGWFAALQKKHAVWDQYRHIIFLPTYKEDLPILRTTLEQLLRCAYDPKKFIIVLAGEERDRARFQGLADTLTREYDGTFGAFLVTEHPSDIPNEIPGKGSNLRWSGQRVKEYVDAEQLPYDNLIVSAFDCDTIVHPEYFACLTTKFLEHPNPYRSSFQPAVLYHNNLWESPAIVRIAAFGTTFWLMTELARPERLLTFSSHSMSWKALVDVGFWESRIVSEDSRIFLQCLLHYHGNYEVTPMYVPVSMDMAYGETYLGSLVALYKQQRRWAWGAENIPYMIWNFAKDKQMKFRTKLYYVFNVGEGMFEWAAAPLLLFVLGRLPMWVAPQSLQQHVLLQNAPFVMERLMQLSMIGLFSSAILGMLLLPPLPEGKRRHVYIVMVLQWLLLPVTLVLFGSIPAIDAQTRLLLGKYLGFKVTPKHRPTS